MSRILDFEDGFESETEASVIGVPASTVTVEPTGNLESTNSQDALVELQENIDDNKTETDAAIETVSDNLDAHVSSTTTALANLNTELDTHTGASSAHGVSGSVVGTTDTQTLTNKKIGDALSFTQVDTPSAPPANTNKLYPKANGKFYYMGPDGVEQPVGSGGGGSKNYLGLINGVDNNGNFELGNTNGWSKFNTTLNAQKIPTGGITLTAASINTFAASASGKLAGSFSLWVTSTGALAAGDGFISDPFTLDAQDLGKSFYASFYYQLTGTGLVGAGDNTNTFAYYLYDVANSKWVQPSSVYAMSSLNVMSYIRGQFQTEINATSYRLAVVCINASGGATDLHFDDFEVGPSRYVYGSPVTDWASFTPTGSWTTNTSYAGLTRRVGGNEEYIIRVTLTGAPNATDLTVNNRPGIVIDTNKIAGPAFDASNLGTAIIKDAGTRFNIGVVGYNSTTSVLVAHAESGNSGIVNATNPMTFATGDVVTLYYSIPVLGASASVQMSDQVDQRNLVFTAWKNGNQALTGDVTNIAWAALVDTHGGWNGTDTYTIKHPGNYSFFCKGYLTSGGTNLYIWVNGTKTAHLVNIYNTQILSGQESVPLKAGDLVTIRAANTVTIAGGASGLLSEVQLIIKLEAGSQTISATDRTICRYTNTAGTSVPASTITVIPFATKTLDTHGSYNPATGVFTARIPGNFRVTVLNTYTALSLATNQGISTYVYKNGSLFSEVGAVFGTGAAGNLYRVGGSDVVPLNAGETMDIRAQSSLSTSLFTTAGYNFISVEYLK